MKPILSVIIPTLNEEDCIENLLSHIQSKAEMPSKLEVLVIDGGSNDLTKAMAKKAGARTTSSKKGRSMQMNKGAAIAKADTLYFLHADTVPPKGFDTLILKTINNGVEAGCFRMKFDSKNPILKFFAWLSRFDNILCRGGDQSLYISKQKFNELGGFDERYIIYEDSEFIRRLYRRSKFKVRPESVITSARRYREKGWFKVQFHFGIIHLKNFLGQGPHELFEYYSKHLLEKK